MRQRNRSANMKCKVSSKDLASMSDVHWSALGEADAFNRSDVISDPLLAHILREFHGEISTFLKQGKNLSKTDSTFEQKMGQN